MKSCSSLLDTEVSREIWLMLLQACSRKCNKAQHCSVADLLRLVPGGGRLAHQVAAVTELLPALLALYGGRVGAGWRGIVPASLLADLHSNQSQNWR